MRKGVHHAKQKEILFGRLTSELRGINGLARVMQEQPESPCAEVGELLENTLQRVWDLVDEIKENDED